MSRSARAHFLILAMLWQALVWFTPWGQEQKMADLSNTMVHAQAVAHHHHNDRSLHMDDLVTDAAQHQHASEAFQPMGLLPAAHGFSLERSRSTRFASSAAPIDAVFLQGPLRPPQTTAA